MVLPLLLSLSFVAQTPSSNPRSVQRWTEDIDFLVQSLSARGVSFVAGEFASRGQKDFEKVYPPAQFQPAIHALKERLPGLSDSQVVLELMRIIATAKISHNNIGMPGTMGFEDRLPITLRWYADGLIVVSATPEYATAAGLRVAKIGGRTPDQVLESLTPFIAQENKVWPRIESERLLPVQSFYAHLGLLDSDGHLPLTLERLDQPPLQLRVRFRSKPEPQTSFRTLLQLPTPVYASGPNSIYWFRYLEDSRTLFIMYSVCANDPKLPMGKFASQVAKELDSRPIDRVVLDLRFNGGGNERVINPLKDAITKHEKARGKLFVLIGARTFSSAIANAIALKRSGATLVGEPTGGRPSSYGEVKTVTLPNSQLLVRFTTKFQNVPASLDFDELSPDVLAPLTFGEIRFGRDSGLAAAIAAK